MYHGACFLCLLVLRRRRRRPSKESETMARFKRPRQYVWRDALPKNHYGKVLKRELRDAATR